MKFHWLSAIIVAVTVVGGSVLTHLFPESSDSISNGVIMILSSVGVTSRKGE